MSKQQPTLTKTCSQCGLQKPLSAFLQFDAVEGAIYGAICAECRKINAEAAPSAKESEESTTSTTGFKIDSKSKVASEIDKRAFRKGVEETYQEEREKDEIQQTAQSEQKETLAKKEKTHRQTFLATRYHKTEKKAPSVTLEEQTEETAKEAFVAQEAAKQTEALTEDQKQKEINLTAPFMDTQIAGKLKYGAGTIYQGFLRSHLGKSAPISEPTEKSDKNSLKDYIDQTWRPKSRGGR